MLRGDLVLDTRIASRSGEYGHAIVDLSNGQRLYAYLDPSLIHENNIDVENAGGAQEFTTVVVREGRPPIEADLTTGSARSSFYRQADEEAYLLGLHPVGHVRYI